MMGQFLCFIIAVASMRIVGLQIRWQLNRVEAQLTFGCDLLLD